MIYLSLTIYIYSAIDDLFDDDEDDEPDSKLKNKFVPQESSNNYLEEDWKLSTEDTEELKLQRIRQKRRTFDRSKEPPNYPIFALLYRFRREYVDQDMESVLADHNSMVKEFPRLLSTEILRYKNTRGATLIWVGLTDEEGEKEELRKEMKSFMEQDPLLTKDIVERYDIMDFDQEALERRRAELELNENKALNA
jgi:hypothetical protein